MGERFAEKVALVTGGSGGIGRVTARAFAAEGAKVAIGDIAEPGGEETVKMIADAGGQALFVRTDVSKSRDVETLVSRAIAVFGRLDYAFNNAAIGGRGGRDFAAADFSEEEWDEYMAVNLKGVWLCMKYEIAEMLKVGSGAIVNMSSGAGLVAVKHISPYVTSKHGVMGLTKTAALDYAQKGIRINAVCPGVILTKRIKDEFAKAPELEALRAAAHPIGRMGEEKEVADAVLWLCSDEASFVIGHGLSIDGGYVVP